ncbi:DNA-binding response OmpR family regulator [Peribacillus sp. V2I11]|nr:hypothetical protein [Peribacillus sp. V2I11]MDQ0883736.1 DNA-binding response OmpR family regulator [Peribacillus sp. V2I11]
MLSIDIQDEGLGIPKESLLKYELMDSGFHVSYFKSGGKAFQKLKTSSPDAIVLDILLEEGEMEGRTILRELKGSADLNEVSRFCIDRT